MPVSDAYATADEYRNGISPHKTDTSDDGSIDDDLEAITRYVERRVDRFFGKDASAVARDFYAPYNGPIYPEAENPWRHARGARMLFVDYDLVSVTSIFTDDNGDGTPETAWATTDYQLLPLNADKGPEPKPYNAIFCPEFSTKLAWPAGRLVRVTGVWGWPAIPAAVKRHVINLTAILRLESPRATSQVNDVGEVLSMSYQAQGIIQELIKHYGKISV